MFTTKMEVSSYLHFYHKTYRIICLGLSLYAFFLWCVHFFYTLNFLTFSLLELLYLQMESIFADLCFWRGKNLILSFDPLYHTLKLSTLNSEHSVQQRTNTYELRTSSFQILSKFRKQFVFDPKVWRRNSLSNQRKLAVIRLA